MTAPWPAFRAFCDARQCLGPVKTESGWVWCDALTGVAVGRVVCEVLALHRRELG